MKNEIILYKDLLDNIKNRIRQGQIKANLSANAEMIATYWDIGRMIHLRQQEEGWGASVIPRLAKDLKNELSDIKGFSERNIRYMVFFYNEYLDLNRIWQLPVAKLEDEMTKPSVSKSKFYKL